MLDSSIFIYNNFHTLPHEFQEKLIEFEKNYKNLSLLPKRFVKDTATFIFKSMLIHGDKYDYSKFNYKNFETKGKILCRIHGEFEQLPFVHVNQKSGCPLCGDIKTSNKLKHNKNDFVFKSKSMHGEKYDYSKFIYKDSKTKSIIICPIHGDFSQTPSSHLSGRGCPKCAGTLKSNSKDFIEKAKTIHGDKYNYNKVNYKNNISKVIITCKEHGDFSQTPANHLSGQGCIKCWKENQIINNKWHEKYETGILYFIECWNNSEKFLKIGVTSRTIRKRYGCKTQMPYQYKILKELNLQSKECFDIEQNIIKTFKSYNPLIYFNGITECLNLSEKNKILKYLNK